jgi:SAM-dependent methyltransferase
VTGERYERTASAGGVGRQAGSSAAAAASWARTASNSASRSITASLESNRRPSQRIVSAAGAKHVGMTDRFPPPPGTSGARPPHDFDAIYAAGAPPWDIGRPQPAFERLTREGGLVGRVLDAGCGTGEHTLLAASLGHEAVGVDISGAAIEQAEAKAAERGLAARFAVFDALRLSEMDEQFDTVLDCGLFHVFDDADRARYVRSLSGAVVPGGCYHMLCFSDRQPGDWGPRRVTEEEVRASFADGWVVDAIDPSVIEVTYDPAGALAWQVTATRT